MFRQIVFDGDRELYYIRKWTPIGWKYWDYSDRKWWKVKVGGMSSIAELEIRFKTRRFKFVQFI